jgi:hypothetical protein
MVVAFGEVLVKDWGLAKVLEGGPSLPETAADSERTEIRSDRQPG